MEIFKGLEVGPGVDWREVVRQRMVEGAGSREKDEQSPYTLFDDLIEQRPQHHRPLAEAMAELLLDEDPVLQAAAVQFLANHPLPELAERILAVARDRRAQYEAAENPLRPGEPLYSGLLAALSRNAGAQSPAANELMRSLLDDPRYRETAFSHLLNADRQAIYARLPELLGPQSDPTHFLLELAITRRMMQDKDFVDLARHLKGADPAVRKTAVEYMRHYGLEPAQEAKVEALLR